MRTQNTTAGQATLEYVAVVAVVAALLLFAAPVLGGPSIARAVVDGFEHALCVAGGDVCNRGDAVRAKLPPCALRSDTTGAEGEATVLSVDVGGGWLLTVSPGSDGSVAVTRTASVSGGASAGPSAGASVGPVHFEAGADGTVRLRVQGARGWTFPDRATADRFLEHAVKNGFDGDRWPAAWWTVEGAKEVAAAVKVLAGAEDVAGGEVVGVSAALQQALGLRRGSDGSHTAYTRFAVSGPDVTVPFIPPRGAGTREWIAEYTWDRRGPRELVLRSAVSHDAGDELAETAAHLDLHDPANLAVARPLLYSPHPWATALAGPAKQAVLDRIATHGFVEETVSRIDDSSWGASASAKAGIKFALGGKRVKVRRTLVDATIRRGGAMGRRLDCLR